MAKKKEQKKAPSKQPVREGVGLLTLAIEWDTGKITHAVSGFKDTVDDMRSVKIVMDAFERDILDPAIMQLTEMEIRRKLESEQKVESTDNS